MNDELSPVKVLLKVESDDLKLLLKEEVSNLDCKPISTDISMKRWVMGKYGYWSC